MSDPITKNLIADLTAAEGERSFVATISTNSIDRDGEVLLPEGMVSTEFEKNPVVFWNHDYSLPPIGKATKLKRERDRWTAKATLAERPEGHEGEWLPDTVHSLMQQGIIKGVSVGFAPVETRQPTAKDMATFGGDRELKQVYSKWNLLEFSVAPLPANQDALISAVSKGIVSRTAAGSLGIELPPKWEADRAVTEPEPPVVDKTPAPDTFEVNDDAAQPPARKTVIIVVDRPALARPKAKPVDYKSIIRREVARQMGRLHV